MLFSSASEALLRYCAGFYSKDGYKGFYNGLFSTIFSLFIKDKQSCGMEIWAEYHNFSSMKLLVYVPLLTPRIKYIFNFIFNEVLKTQVGFSSNLEEFRKADIPKISYADHPIGDELFFRNSDLLLSHTIVPPTIKTTAFGDTIVPFAVKGSTLPFDVFAASFYFVSRYEEYLPYNRNDNCSFSPDQSLQHKLKLLEIPVIDAWALILKNILVKRFPKLLFFKKAFTFQSIVCMVPVQKHRSHKFIHMASRVYGTIKSKLTSQDGRDFKQMEIKNFIESLQEPYRNSPQFYFNSPKDTSNACEGEMRLPESCLKSINAGLNHDFRMGYPKTPGFRAGTCTPFYWYDLQLEKNTHLRLYPIAVNDTSFKLDRHLNTILIHAQMKNLFDTVKLLDGSFYVLWHQDNLDNAEKGKFGRKLYKEMLANFLPLAYDLQLK
jgi:hypothetical protein